MMMKLLRRRMTRIVARRTGLPNQIAHQVVRAFLYQRYGVGMTHEEWGQATKALEFFGVWKSFWEGTHDSGGLFYAVVGPKREWDLLPLYWEAVNRKSPLPPPPAEIFVPEMA